MEVLANLLRGTSAVLLVLPGLFLAGCETVPQNLALGTAGSTILGARSPSHEIQQTYYLGVFDPQEQLPPAVYRVRVHGQASFISGVKFASGWVPADVLDALGSSISFDKETGQPKVGKTEGDFETYKTGRRLMMFGPEGFREAPANHRLVILMGSSPEDFFNSVNESLGIVAQATQEQGGAKLKQTLFEMLADIRAQRIQINEFLLDVQRDLPAGGAL